MTRTLKLTLNVATALFTSSFLSLGAGCGGDDSASTAGDGGNPASGHLDGAAGSAVDATASAGVDAGTGRNSADGAGPNAGSPLAVNLGTAANYVILAKTGISTVPISIITGDLGLSPAAASYVTGFSLVMDSTNVFSTSTQLTGKVYASDYAAPTPSTLTTAISDMQTAFTDAAGRAPTVTELGAGNIGGLTLSPGVYGWGTGLLIPSNVTLAGGANDVWIFQIAQDLTLSSATKVSLTGGAIAKNVFWEVAGAVSLGSTSQFQGIVMAQTAIALETGASVNGRLLAQTAVSLDGSTVVQPSP